MPRFRPWTKATVVIVTLSALMGGPGAMSQTDDRPEPTSKARRIVYNDDGGALKHLTDKGLDGYLSERLKGLVGTQVDTIFFCAHDDWAKAFYTSKIEGVDLSASAHLHKLLAEGVDPMQATIDFCRHSGMEIFHSFRMNDIHDSFDRRLGKAKRDHPEWLLGSYDAEYPLLPNGFRSLHACNWSSMNFALPEVREHILRSIEEVMERWDWDGFELDYGRNACLFKSVFEGGSATDEDRATLTAFHRRIREMTAPYAEKTGRPFPIAVVLPETVSLAMYVGMDIETWLDEDLVDIIIAGNGYVPFSPRALDMIDVGRRHGVPVYIRLNANTGGSERPYHHRIEVWRGFAANAWTAGASGVYVFNTYDRERFSEKELDIYNQIGDPQAFAGRDRTYLVDWDFSRWGYGGGDVAFYMPLDNLLPMPLRDKERCVEFACLEDVSSLEPLPNILLRLTVKDLSDDDVCSFLFNGEPLPPPSEERLTPKGRVFEHTLLPVDVRRGANRIEARYEPAEGSAGEAMLVGAELRIHYEMTDGK